MYRISDINQIINPRIINLHKASIFGGLEYSAEEKETKSNRLLLRGAVNYSSLQYLPGTEIEAVSIYNKILPMGISANLYTAKNGTEEVFKSDSISNTNILHIATHGISSSSEDPYAKPYWYSLADYLLDLSSLALSGVEGVIDKEYRYGNGGLLEGSEIADLNLSNVSLATLSMCDGFRGINTSEDNWSLTKAFKIAGANSILASLWSVNDAATCKLMTEFYTNWISKKMTKHDALEAAKKTVRSTKGWEDPKYWAAFILLDGLD